MVLAGEIPDRVSIAMNGLKLEADLLHGQKTGVYLDQRENYVAAARCARGRVLDCFTSTGGFALHAAGRAETCGGDRFIGSGAGDGGIERADEWDFEMSNSGRRTCSNFLPGSSAAIR